jgi:(E)-4-hydroxy-3-methylbut-2-enyl-diphosphate synthase
MRRNTIDVRVGSVGIGSDHPIRVQSMTTTDTMDTEGTIAQSIRLIEEGCELVRITAPSMREARNLEVIKKGLRERGFDAPLVADIHYTPNAAEVAARIVEKVRINPGNYVDKKRGDVIEYDEASYQAELDRIRERFLPLVRICKEHGTAMRIGTNHGSLSDRIMSRYGDNPAGMVESALEFLRIADDEGFHNIVLSMKSSNPIVMIAAYRLLVERLETEGLQPYPLHLGVTEAGDGEDGRVKSALGIGTLLEDGLGDTIRVSLTEEPEAEIPVAAALARRYDGARSREQAGPQRESWKLYDPFTYRRRRSTHVASIGGDHVPRVFADVRGAVIGSEHDLAPFGHHYDEVTEKWTMTDQAAEFLVMGRTALPFMAPTGVRQVLDHDAWSTHTDKLYCVPMFDIQSYASTSERHKVMNVVRVDAEGLTPEQMRTLGDDATVVLILSTSSAYPYQSLRDAFLHLLKADVHCPVIIERDFTDFVNNDDVLDDRHVLYTATDVGGLLADGFGDGMLLSTAGGARPRSMSRALRDEIRLSYGILQAARTRMTKTEYISCPSCGRTLFDLQETTGMIRSHTDHLKGVKIGIMGCIVNGPGEMADADYGYVGSGPDKITLYRGQDIVKRAVKKEEAVDQLIALIKEDGRWIDRA